MWRRDRSPDHGSLRSLPPASLLSSDSENNHLHFFNLVPLLSRQLFLSQLTDQWRQRRRRRWSEVRHLEKCFLYHTHTLFQMRVLYYVIILPGSTPSRSAGFLGTSSPGPMADLYGTASQESAVSSYLSAASPAPSTGFSHSLGVRPFDLLFVFADQRINPECKHVFCVLQGPLIATAFTNGYH